MRKITQHLKYLKYIARHKYYVFVEGWKLNVPLWRLIVHDWTKLLPKEFFAYSEYFYGPYGLPEPDLHTQNNFDAAWNHHQKHNSHHYQYHMLIRDSGEWVALLLPYDDMKEMIADWRGAGLAVGNINTIAWYENNKERILLHKETRDTVEDMLEAYR